MDSAGTILVTFKTNSKAPTTVQVKKPVKVTAVKATKAKKQKPDTGKREWKSDLPTLEELRAQAESKGIDITSLGRKRKEIHILLQESEAVVKAKNKVEKAVKTAVKEAAAAVGQSSDSTKPKRKTVVRRRKKNVVDLKTATVESEAVDLDRILEG